MDVHVYALRRIYNPAYVQNMHQGMSDVHTRIASQLCIARQLCIASQRVWSSPLGTPPLAV
jgi:hypothetical protein